MSTLARGDMPSGTDPNVQASFRKYQELETAKRNIRENMAKLTARREQLETSIDGTGMTDKEFATKIKALQEQNRQLEEQIENLRENIAVQDQYDRAIPGPE